MVAPTAVEAAEAADDDIYRLSALIFVVAEPSEQIMVRTNIKYYHRDSTCKRYVLCCPRRWPLPLALEETRNGVRGLN